MIDLLVDWFDYSMDELGNWFIKSLLTGWLTDGLMISWLNDSLTNNSDMK